VNIVSKTSFIVLAVVLFGIIGDLYYRDVFRIIGITLAVLFFIFLVVYQWIERKNDYTPNKKDKEG
jgi:energy-coupling factor transporter transmembrane protein EcfT